MDTQSYAGSRSLTTRMGLPPSLFLSGQEVQVILNERKQDAARGSYSCDSLASRATEVLLSPVRSWQALP